jgi:transposase
MSEQQQLRVQEHRLKFLRYAQSTGNVAKTCRRYGISRSLFYQWRQRYQQDGPQGLRNRSRAHKRCPKSHPAEVVEKILHLRQQYHFGPWRIHTYLTRYHDISIAKSSIYYILRKHGLSRLPQNQRYKRLADRWKRYEKPQPGCRVQIDVKFLKRIGNEASSQRHYFQFTAIDDCTRLRVLKIYERNNQQSAMNFVDYVLSRLPFQVDVIQTDNGAEFDDNFHYHVQDLGIKHVYIKPRTPRLNVKVERSHRIDEEEFYALLDGVVIDSAASLNSKVKNGSSSITISDHTAP